MEEKNLERQKRKEEQKKKKMEKFAEKMKNIEKQPVKKSEKVSKSKNVPEKQTVKSVKLKQPKEKGEMKDLSGPMGQFDPIEVEYGWYDWWEKQKLFKPETIKKFRDDVKSPYVIPIPPPNVTGKLHIGHSMMIAIQDAIARFKRMQGHEVLYVPGTDHAGIATQTVVERKLYTKLGKTRHNLGRDAFLDEVWKWKEQYGNNIIEQIKRMGTSVDMDRFAFTLDDQRYEAVIECFVRLFEQGYIYRENRLVNWSSKLSTAISDLEIEYKDIEPHTKLQVDGQSYMFGVLYYVKYPIISKKISDEQLKLGSNLNQTEFIEIATTRPETILGDTAICVNPKDEKCEKYKDMVAINPLTHEPVKIIFDEFANLEFGTGKLKITPAHDFNDFEIGNKHNLETIRIFDENNKIIIKGAYFGMKRFDARLKVVENLKENGLFLKEEGYKQTLPFCSRSGDILEPLIKKQWWMKCKEFADKAIDSVKNEEIKLYPESATVQWNHWLTNIRDWCLSRQLWWGHRIPAYRVFTSGESEKLTRYSGESDNPTGSSGENHNP
ncbi:Valyl-tRNA synthetase, partial [Pseudoloma neurophilia]